MHHDLASQTIALLSTCFHAGFASLLANYTGRVFSSNYTTPGLPFMAVLQNAEQLQQPHPRHIVNRAKYLSGRITWRLHIEMIESKTFRSFIRVCSLFKSERLNANIKLTLHKKLIRYIIIYACPS
jgi:hypothetical protein